MTVGDAPLARVVRREWIVYGAVVGALLVVVGVVFGVIVSSGEAAHAHLSTARTALPTVPSSALPAATTAGWATTDSLAIGQPVSGGTVITYDRHSVTGRNVLTGAAVWTYTRTDSRLCNVAVVEGKAVALYAHGSDCDEVDAFDAGTGRRSWERTLDQDGHPVNGTPTVIATSDTVLVYTADVAYAILLSSDPCSAKAEYACGQSRWDYPADTGCRIESMVAGSSGVLIAQACGSEQRLLLHDRDKAYKDADNKVVAVLWSTTGPARFTPLAADGVVLATTTAGQAIRYDPTTGKVLATLAIAGVGPTVATKVGLAGSTTLLWSAGQCVALSSAGQVRWTISTPALPDLDVTGDLLVGVTRGVAVLDADSGAVASTSTADADLSGSRLVRVGAGFLAAKPGGAGVAAYR